MPPSLFPAFSDAAISAAAASLMLPLRTSGRYDAGGPAGGGRGSTAEATARRERFQSTLGGGGSSSTEEAAVSIHCNVLRPIRSGSKVPVSITRS